VRQNVNVEFVLEYPAEKQCRSLLPNCLIIVIKFVNWQCSVTNSEDTCSVSNAVMNGSLIVWNVLSAKKMSSASEGFSNNPGFYALGALPPDPHVGFRSRYRNPNWKVLDPPLDSSHTASHESIAKSDYLQMNKANLSGETLWQVQKHVQLCIRCIRCCKLFVTYCAKTYRERTCWHNSYSNIFQFIIKLRIIKLSSTLAT
jgi:hypothetical protein